LDFAIITHLYIFTDLLHVFAIRKIWYLLILCVCKSS